MLDKILWNTILLPQGIKKRVIWNYHQLSPLNNGFDKFFNFLYRIHKNKKDSIPAFSLLKNDKKASIKLNKLFKWGLSPCLKNENNHNMIHEVLSLNFQGCITLENTKKLLNCLFSNNVNILEGNNSIGQYEKGLYLESLIKDKELKYMVEDSHKLIDKVILVSKILEWSCPELIDYIINHEKIKQDEKSLLDYAYLRNLVNELQLQRYMVEDKKRNVFLINTIEKIIDRGNIFSKQNNTYHSLKHLFSLENLEELISKRMLLKCYEQFSTIKLVAKKSLTSQLITKQKETAIFNLLSYGLNLNWSIKKNDGKENIVALEILYSIPMIKMILSSEKFNICCSNTNGENILHLLGSVPLINNEIKQSLTNRINELSETKKSYLLNQISSKGLTPLYKAMYEQDQLMIDYLLSWKIDIEEQLNGLPEDYNSAINFLDNILLSVARGEIIHHYIEYNETSYTFWQGLSREWHSEKLFNHLHVSLQHKEISKIIVKL